VLRLCCGQPPVSQLLAGRKKSHWLNSVECEGTPRLAVRADTTECSVGRIAIGAGPPNEIRTVDGTRPLHRCQTTTAGNALLGPNPFRYILLDLEVIMFVVSALSRADLFGSEWTLVQAEV
jgi:hypothetical protein